MNRTLVYLVIILLLQLGNASAQSSAKRLGQFFDTLELSGQFSGGAVVAGKGKVMLERYAGEADRKSHQPVTAISQFPVASVSKTFTATAILQLKEQGKLRLDDPVKKYLTDFPYPSVTIRHLLSNTSGLGQYYTLFDSIMTEQPAKVISNRDIIPAFMRFHTPLQFTPGDKWEYNNLNFCLAALIVEKVTGLPFSRYLQQFIFKPAGMQHTFLPVDRGARSKDQVELYSYRKSYSRTLENVNNLPVPFQIDAHSNFYGNGGIVSTAADLQLYDKALHAGKLLSLTALTAAFTPAKLNNGKIASYHLDDKEVAYGLGWEMFTDTTRGRIVFHDGSITGLTSMLAHNLSTGQAVVLIDNTGSTAIFDSMNALFSLLAGKSAAVPKPALARIYGSTLMDEAAGKAQGLISNYLKDKRTYNVTERQFIRMGYEMIRDKKLPEALEVFRTATVLYPNSWNAFDSYGEALLLNGQKTEARNMYERSVALNPANENGKKMLEGLKD